MSRHEGFALKTNAKYVQTFMAAKGHGDAHDMMRYDNAVPADEGQSHKLSGCGEAGTTDQWVIFRRFVPIGSRLEPSIQRWKSFGWEALGPFDSQREAEERITREEADRVREAAGRLGAQ